MARPSQENQKENREDRADGHFVPLPHRGIVGVKGPQRRDFLQRLVSNDVGLLDTQKSLYACLLTPQGKFLHDFFMTEQEDEILLDCEGAERAQDLTRRLQGYRLRAEVAISCMPDVPLYAVFPSGETALLPPGAFPDPRHADMGWRSRTRPEISGMEEKPFTEWNSLRLSLGIADGSRDLVPGVSTLAEGHIAHFHGVSYTKGCYVGQELTARMHHRGTGKRHLYPVRFEGGAPAPGTEIHLNGESVGEMRSSCGETGLALLRDEAAEKLRIPGPIRVL